MTTTTLTSLQEAAARLLDAVMTHEQVKLDVSMENPTDTAIERLIEAVNSEARRRGIGVKVEAGEGAALCLSLRRL